MEKLPSSAPKDNSNAKIIETSLLVGELVSDLSRALLRPEAHTLSLIRNQVLARTQDPSTRDYPSIQYGQLLSLAEVADRSLLLLRRLNAAKLISRSVLLHAIAHEIYQTADLGIELAQLTNRLRSWQQDDIVAAVSILEDNGVVYQAPQKHLPRTPVAPVPMIYLTPDGNESYLMAHTGSDRSWAQDFDRYVYEKSGLQPPQSVAASVPSPELILEFAHAINHSIGELIAQINLLTPEIQKDIRGKLQHILWNMLPFLLPHDLYIGEKR